MKALIRNGEIQEIVFSLDGIDLEGLTVVDDVPEPVTDYEWSAQTQAFEPQPIIARLQRQLDNAVDAIRARYPAAGRFIAEEYRLTAEQALSFQEGGYAGEVPLSVDAWSRAAGMTAQEATDDILQTKAMYETMLLITRDVRLNGKAQIALCASAADAQQVYDTTLAQLESQLPQPT